MEDNKNRFVPPFVTAKDIAKIEDCSHSAARGVFKRLRKKLDLTGMRKLSLVNYCNERGLSLNEVISRLLKFIIILISAGIAYAFAKKLLEYSCEFFRTHEMIWEEHTPTYLKGHTYVYDSTTHTNEKVTIEITKFK